MSIVSVDPEVFSNVANLILNTAEECLAASVLGVPEDAFVSHNRPPDDCCDFISVWYRRLFLTKGFPSPFGGAARCNDLSIAADMTLVWKRPCWPTVKADPADPFPAPDLVQIAADNLLIDARLMMCCMLAAYETGELTPSTLSPNYTFRIAWGALTPLRTGDCAGWQWDFSVEIPSCCEWPGSGSGSGSG